MFRVLAASGEIAGPSTAGAVIFGEVFVVFAMIIALKFYRARK